MKKRLLFLPLAAIVAGAAMLLAVPFVAAQITVDNPPADTSNGVDAAVVISGSSGSYNVPVVNVTADPASFNQRAVGVLTNDFAGAFNLNTISISGSATGGISGFVHSSAIISPFAGTINATGKHITATNTNGAAWGVAFTDDAGTGHSDLDSNTKITFGNITATGTTGATGFTAGENAASISLGDVTARSTGGAPATVKGVALQNTVTGSSLTGSSLTIGNIIVDGGGGAMLTGSGFGIQIGDINPSVAGNLASKTNVESITVRATDQAYGFQVTGNVTGNIDVNGKISAHGGTSGSNGAAGFAVYGNNTGDIGLGDIEASGNWAVGAHFVGDVGGNVKIGNVRAIAGDHEANGLRLQGTASTVAIGGIVAESAGANAFGIQTDNEANLTLKGDIAVKGFGNDTSGIRSHAGSVDIILDGNVNISEQYTGAGPWNGASIWTNGKTTIDLSGHTLNTGNVKLDGVNDLTVRNNGLFNAKGDVTVGGNLGVFDGARVQLFGKVSTPTTSLKNGATLAVDGTKADLGVITFETFDNRLEIFGNTNEMFHPVGQVVIGSDADLWNARMQFFNTSELTDWRLESNGVIRSAGARARANVNDNYLAASRMHHKYTAWNAVRDHLISGAGAVDRYGYYGQSMACGQMMCLSGCCNKVRNVWANYVGRNARYQSSFNRNEWRMSNNGIQFGTDFIRTPRAQLGAFFGYENLMGTNAGDHIKGDDYYVGMYAVHVFHNGADVRTVFAYGWQDFTSQRRGADNNLYNMAFKGNTAELNIEFGQRHYFNNWSARPSIAIDWHLSNLNGGREIPAAGNSALRYDSTDLSQLFFRFGTDLRYSCGRLTLDSGLYYSYDMLGKNLQSGVSNTAGTLRSTLAGSTLGRSVISYNLGTSWMVNDKFSIFGGYRGEYVPESTGKGYANTGYVGAALRW